MDALAVGAFVALWVIAIRFVDLYWLVVPSFDTSAVPHWLDFVVVIGIGGIWLWYFVGRLLSHPVLPLRDPSLPEVEA